MFRSVCGRSRLILVLINIMGNIMEFSMILGHVHAQQGDMIMLGFCRGVEASLMSVLEENALML